MIDYRKLASRDCCAGIFELIRRRRDKHFVFSHIVENLGRPHNVFTAAVIAIEIWCQQPTLTKSYTEKTVHTTFGIEMS
jgi:hypothetical protein